MENKISPQQDTKDTPNQNQETHQVNSIQKPLRQEPSPTPLNQSSDKLDSSILENEPLKETSSKAHIKVLAQENLTQPQGFQFAKEAQEAGQKQEKSLSFDQSEKTFGASSFKPSVSAGASYTGLKILGLFGIVVAIGMVVYFALMFSDQITQNQQQASIQAILSEAQTLADQNNPQGALTTIEKGLEKHPNNQSLLKSQRDYENEVEISQILKQANDQSDPSQALTTLATGLTLFPESTSLKEAQAALKKSLKSDALEAAKHYEEAKNYQKALAILDEAMGLIGEDSDLVARKQQDAQKEQEKVKTQQAQNQIKVATPTPTQPSVASTPPASPTPSAPQTSTPPTSPAQNAFVLPNSATQAYSYEQVAQSVHSQADLELAINEIYARKGRSFDTPKYKSYFESQSWYTPIYSSSAFDAQRDTLLSPIEIQNIETLVAYGQNQGWR